MARTKLPASVDALQEIVLQQQSLLDAKDLDLDAKDLDLDAKQSQLDALQEQVAFLEEWNRLLRSQRFGAKSEKVPPEQGRLFNEAELEADNDGGDEPDNGHPPGNVRFGEHTIDL